jgi:hypothetical protein
MALPRRAEIVQNHRPNPAQILLSIGAFSTRNVIAR